MSSLFTFEPAQAKDDADLRRLLRETVMPGNISVTFEREPSFFAANAIEGGVSQSFVAREDSTGLVAALASRSVHTAYLNGQPRPLGYLSQARIAPAFKGNGLLLRGGYRILKAAHQDGQTSLYVSTIIADNKAARRVFEADWSAKPTYRPFAEIVTLVLPVRNQRRRRLLPGVQIRKALPSDTAALVDCVNRNYCRYQFAPFLRPEDLLSPGRHLQATDFWVAEAHGRIVGCVGLWNQMPVRQTVVRGYAGYWRWIRPPINLLARALGTPRLPNVGEFLRAVFLSFSAVDEDNSQILIGLIDAAMAESCGRAAFLNLGFVRNHPFTAAVQRAYWHTEYRSILYLVFWPDGAEQAHALNSAIPHVEIAAL